MSSWRQLYYLCTTLLVALFYVERSSGNTTATERITFLTDVETTVTQTTALPPTTTLPVPPLASPVIENIEEVASNNTAFIVSWSHDVDDNLNVMYYISVNATDGLESAENVTATTGNVTVITDKTPGQEYEVKVVVVDDENGRSSSSDVETFRLSPNVVANLTRKYSNSTMVQADWDRPDGEVSGYQVNCSDGSPDQAVISNENETEASCSGGDIAGKAITVTVVTDSADKSSLPLSVTIRANPNPVVNLKESSANTTSVTAAWLDPGGEVDDYGVNCSSGVESEVRNNGNESEVSCTEIGAGDTITVTVYSISNGTYSTPVSVNITAFPNPVELSESDASTENVTVSWVKPNGTFDFYNATCFGGSLLEEPSLNSTSATCIGVTAGSLVTVVVNTTSGDKESSADLDVRAVPNAVDLTESNATDSSVSVTWTNPGGVFENYNATCSDGSLRESLTNDSTEATCVNVTAGELITITVNTISGTKINRDSEDVRALPFMVLNLSEENATTNSISASWEFPGGVVSKYEVSCSNGNAMPSEILNEMDTTEYFSSCEHLPTPGANYTMTVISVSGDKDGAPDTVQITAVPDSPTLEGLPSTVDNVSVAWDRPDGVVDVFKVICEPKDISSPVQEEIDADGPTFKATCTVQRPGELFNVSVFSVSGDKNSSVSEQPVRARPADVEGLRNKTRTQTSVVIEWNRPDGVITDYDTTIVPVSGERGSENGRYNGSTEDNIQNVTFQGLTPGTKYNITVCTKSDDETCITPARITVRSLPALPSKPVGVDANADDIRTVTVTFSEPEDPNGYIREYIIRYSGEKDQSESQEGNQTVPAQDGESSYSERISDLVPGYTYTFKVSAVNEAGEGDPETAVATLGQEKPLESTTAPETIVTGARSDIKTITVLFFPEWFSHCNGELKNYSVFVVEEGGDNKTTDPPRTYKDAQKQKKLPLYAAIANETYPFPPDNYSLCRDGQRRKRASDSYEPVEVTIGNETCNGGENYCNGELHGNREYRVMFQACNEVGCSETEFSDAIKTAFNHISWVIPLVIVILILLLAAVGFLMWKERQEPGFVKKYVRPKHGVENPGFSHDKPMRRTGDKRPVKLAEFDQFLEDMSRDSDYLFSEEYNDLRPVGKNQSTEAAVLEVNRVKNRFSNILPYDHTRVGLSPIDDEEGSDYINANYMLGFNSQREYIACQGPLQSTEEDMWRLVWEQGASLIVMVTQLMENGKIKCHQYWPDEGEGPVRYGEIIVNPLKVTHEPLWTIRKFQITRGPSTRSITHFNFLAWPDHGVPEKPDDLIQFVQTVRNSKKHDGKPLIVHCSAGVGRTGTFISLDHLMNAMQERDEVDIFGMVRSMRMNRCMMVQTESQYIFIHQCVQALLEGSSNSDQVYENVNGNGYFNEALI